MKQIPPVAPVSPAFALPEPFLRWFAAKGWRPRAHQLDLLARVRTGESMLLIAPTGAGKTLAGFLPSLVALTERGRVPPGTGFRGIHTLYISPLKALAVDIERNLMTPVTEMGLPIRVENRTGDTPQSKRQRQKLDPPDILLTTPEQVALLIANGEAERFFKDLKYVIFDELHSLVISKRGHLLALGLARLRRLAPELTTIGLSATVADPLDLQRWLVAQAGPGDDGTGAPAPERAAGVITVAGGAKPEISILASEVRVPWSGHSASYAMPEVYEAIKRHRTALLFVNTRNQAERLFQALWTINDDNLPIALHHGSLDVGQRRKVEAAMSKNRLRAVVATSTLDLGIDWGDVDLVIHVGAPKGASRLAQRIGRSNHRMDEPSQAILVPANRFEVMECQAALDANYLGAQDTPPVGHGALDVLAQHVLGMACAAPFEPLALYDEITSASPYAELTWETFERIIDFVATGGYALRTYERYARIRKTPEGLWRVSNGKVAQQYRLNIGTIIESPMLNVRLVGKMASKSRMGRGGLTLGKVEEFFLEMLSPGDTFLFGGKVIRFEGIHENECLVTQGYKLDPKIPSYAGGKFPLSTYLAAQVRRMLADPEAHTDLPDQVRDWLSIQRDLSMLPREDELLIETFPYGNRHFMVAYAFEGRLAHQTLGMLLTRRLDRAGLNPMGFVATDYSLAIWGMEDMTEAFRAGHPSLADLFDEDMLGDDLEAWLDESYLLKRTFRNCAIIAGLIEPRHPGKEKTGRQVTVSSDLIYDVLRSHEPDHILLEATRNDASTGLLDIGRLGDMLVRIKSHIVHRPLERVSPLAVPIMLEIGRESVPGQAPDALLAEAADELILEAMGEL